MTNLSLGSRVHFLVGVTLVLFLVFGFILISGHGLGTWLLFGLVTLLLGLTFYTVQRILGALEMLAYHLKEAATGRLDHRITNIKKGAATAELAWALNDVLDQQEAYFREVFSAFEHASKGETYRLAMDQGLHGAFKDAMIRINVSVDSMGQVQRMALKEKLIAHISDLNSGHLITDLKSVQDYLMQMTQELGSVGDLSKETAQEAEESRTTIEDIVTNLNRMTEMVTQTNNQIALIHEKSDEINLIVQVISEVADRTNLLALNAAIEAAHAGDVGKGFAVVAEEVRTLSENTKDAAASIAATIGSFGRATTKMIEDSEQVKELAEGSQEAVTDFRSRVLKFATSARQSLGQILKAQDVSFASLVKLDHFIFKQNGYRVVNMGNHSSEAQAVRTDHHDCRLGKWYEDGQGAELFSRVPSYPRLEDPHARVHSQIHEAVHLLEQPWERDLELQKRIVGHFEAAEKASIEVLRTIDQMVEERHQA
jgi:methyl-accepting chemotaxis protein